MWLWVWAYFGTSERDLGETFVNPVMLKTFLNVGFNWPFWIENIQNAILTQEAHSQRTHSVCGGRFWKGQESFPVMVPRQRALRKDRLRWSTVVQDVGFHTLIKHVEPRYALPSRRHFSDVCLPELWCRCNSHPWAYSSRYFSLHLQTDGAQTSASSVCWVCLNYVCYFIFLLHFAHCWNAGMLECKQWFFFFEKHEY